MNYRLLVLLAGCGAHDGSDPHETVLGLHFAEKHGFEPHCVAPAMRTLHRMSHLTGETVAEEGDDLREMAARLVKGRLLEPADLPPRFADAVFIPGGQGVIKNLLGGLGGEPHEPTLALIREAASRRRPLLAVSLAELLVSRATGRPFGKGCFDIPPDAVYEEEGTSQFLTPGFTAARSLGEAAAGIEHLFVLARRVLERGAGVLPLAGGSGR